jgi:hypothetical protein
MNAGTPRWPEPATPTPNRFEFFMVTPTAVLLQLSMPFYYFESLDGDVVSYLRVLAGFVINPSLSFR